MAGLLDQLMPSEDEAKRRALTAAALALLGTHKGGEGQGFSRAGLLGMGVYDQSLENQALNTARKLSIAEHLRQLQAQEQAAQGQTAAFNAWRNLPGPTGGDITTGNGPPESFQTRGGAAGAFGATPSINSLPTQIPAIAGLQAAGNDPVAQKLAEANAMEVAARKATSPIEGMAMFAAAQKLRSDAEGLTKLRDKFSATPQVMRDKNGQLVSVQLSESGAPPRVVPGLTPAEKVHFAETGGMAAAAFDPYTGLPITAGVPKTMTPSEKDTSARGWAGINLQKQTLEQGRWTNDLDRGLQINTATGETRPMMAGGRPIGSKQETKAQQSAGKVLDIITEAEKLLDTATNSYGGVLFDQLGRIVGASTEGATAIAQLKTLEGMLMLNQPRMEGPQSDKDTMIYRQMAAQIGDPTVPRAQKKAALGTLRSLQEKYLDTGATPNSTSKTVPFSSLPKG